MTVKRYLVTTAVSDTRLHRPFWASLQVAAKHLGAEIIVQASVYRNPSARYKKVKSDDVYPKELLKHLTRKRRILGKNLTLFADVPLQPTASNPTSGLEVLCAGSSAILGHVKRQLHVVPTAGRAPRLLWTTGACTLPSYSKSKAGARAKEHHVIGALVVEVCSKGRFFIRNVTSTSRGAFTDLDTVYTPEGVSKAPRALSVVLGDTHVDKSDPHATQAARELVALLKPKNLVLHDVYDGNTRSHHKTSKRERFPLRNRYVRDEVQRCGEAIADMSKWSDDMTTWVVDCNHHDHLSRWLEEHDTNDLINTPYWHELWSSIYTMYQNNGVWPLALQIAIEDEMIVPTSVKWLGREDILRIGGVVHHLHGDIGPNGARGSLLGFSKMGSKVTVGHSHTPGIKEACYQTGVLGRLDMDYNTSPSTWLQAHVVLGHDAKRQMVVCQKASFRG